MRLEIAQPEHERRGRLEDVFRDIVAEMARNVAPDLRAVAEGRQALAGSTVSMEITSGPGGLLVELRVRTLTPDDMAEIERAAGPEGG